MRLTSAASAGLAARLKVSFLALSSQLKKPGVHRSGSLAKPRCSAFLAAVENALRQLNYRSADLSTRSYPLRQPTFAQGRRPTASIHAKTPPHHGTVEIDGPLRHMGMTDRHAICGDKN